MTHTVIVYTSDDVIEHEVEGPENVIVSDSGALVVRGVSSFAYNAAVWETVQIIEKPTTRSTRDFSYDFLDIARVIHEANRALQKVNGDPVSPPFDEAPEWMIDSTLDGINHAQQGTTPEESHKNWMQARLNDGWVYGPEKDETTKTHPCLVPYEALPPEQKVKDALFLAIFTTLYEA